jgi:CRP-like cAMP-binding protein
MACLLALFHFSRASPEPFMPGTDVPDSPLTAGLSPHEVAQLRELLVTHDAREGFLFRAGDEATSMFIVVSGRVEVRVTNPETRKVTRLGCFGAGGILGEISLLSTCRRTADAVCVEPCRLLELTRECMDHLQATEPRLHARLLRNLGVHLANRLVIATDTLQAQQ